ncbi:MAG: PLP-dependent aminotransferase family protein, partial [Vicinamibacteraceae bacterium]
MPRIGYREPDCMPAVYFSAARLTRVLAGWSDGSGPLSSQLIDAVRDHIRSGQLPAGVRLPSERQLAAALGIARTTVSKAFDVLRADGLLASRTGVGTFVSAAGRHATARGDDRLRSFAHEPGESRIDLCSAALPGVPFVAEELARQSAADFGATLATHGYIPAGLPILRTAIAEYYTELGLPTDPTQVLVTSGAQQAIRLVAQALLEPGHTVLLEEPTYRGAIEVMRSAGARLVGIPSGADGVDVEALADAARQHKASLIFLQSTVQN